jgi:hypothetical protein
MIRIAASVGKSRTSRADRIARRCPGRTNEQTRSSSASERGRQRLQKRDPRERSEQSDLARAAQVKWEETA